jgi:hypothetical protein
MQTRYGRDNTNRYPIPPTTARLKAAAFYARDREIIQSSFPWSIVIPAYRFLRCRVHGHEDHSPAFHNIPIAICSRCRRIRDLT